jgi:broad specificity phosphatase PhoE
MSQNGESSSGHYQGSSIKQLWEQFQADEKRYTSEAKWERFPEGSRIFIGESPMILLGGRRLTVL